MNSFNNIDDIILAINAKRISYKVREGIDNITVIRVYSSEFQPSSLEIRTPFTKPASEYNANDVAEKVELALLNGEIAPVKAYCNHIVKVYSIKSKKEEVTGIFPTLVDAKEQITFMDTLFMGNVILYIDAPDGLYFYGEENRYGNKKRWFTPEELDKVLIYDSEKDEVVCLDSLITFEKWWEFSAINKMKQELQHPVPTDVKPVISVMKPVGVSGTGETVNILKPTLRNESESHNKRMSKEEMVSFIGRISRTELLMEIKELAQTSISSRYLKAVRVSLIELGYDPSWVETEFKDALEEKYMHG